MKNFRYLLLFVLFISQCRPKEENTVTEFPGKPVIPSSIKKEHKSLLEQLHKITLFQDSTGHVALKLYDLIQHHFKEEEDYVLPPLGLLPSLASGKIPAQSKEVRLLTEKLKSQLTHINVEHQLIKAFTGELLLAAAKDQHPEIIEFESELSKHADTEEEVFFPAAILIGEYLNLKSNIKQ